MIAVQLLIFAWNLDSACLDVRIVDPIRSPDHRSLILSSIDFLYESNVQSLTLNF